VVDAFSITYNGDAKVRGAELDVTADITNNWNARFSVSYAKGEFENAVQPCRDSDFNGVPDGGTPTVAGFQGAGVNVATCATSGPINGLPEWNYTLQSQYTFDLPRGGEAYVRGLANYKSEGRIVSSAEPVKAYGTLDLYIGAKDFIEGLDVNIFAKNIFDETRKFDQGGLMNTLSVVPTGYRSVFYTPGREIGISVHKSFGGG
jgi:iron complex outermembrane receptor protein